METAVQSKPANLMQRRSRAFWVLLVVTLLLLVGLAVAAQVGGFLAYQHFSDIFSSAVRGAASV